ncbi:Caspase-1 [Frankliniella fusca]|uniref:Caspase-1 n=1 Tax=Frankliniella fusca TaxID=407009 RepID=A0AAE1HUR6_9NEOP|nr:Caspase-1 [Frankliniella fusca]
MGETIQKALNFDENDSFNICFVDKMEADCKYNMTSRGLALIFAHQTFEVIGENLPDRNCCEKDIDLSVRCFEGLRFEVRVMKDKKLNEIRRLLYDVQKEDHTDISCLVIIISTHGTYHNFLYANDLAYHVDELFRPFHAAKCQTLVGKPKLFFIQACRGEHAQFGIELGVDKGTTSTEEKYNLGKVFLPAANEDEDDVNPFVNEEYEQSSGFLSIEDDYLVGFSTIPRYVSFQNSDGSWYIRSLCEELSTYNECHLLHILTFVNGKVAIQFESNIPSKFVYHRKKQMSSVTSRLKKFLVRTAYCQLVVNFNYTLTWDLSMPDNTMDRIHIMEEKLRESACIGDLETLQILLQKGVDVNAKHDINALHWAAKRGHRDVVRTLLVNGADISLRTKSKDTALSLCSNPEIRQILLKEIGEDTSAELPTESRLPIIPNYLRNPPLADHVDIPETRHSAKIPERLPDRFVAMEYHAPLPEEIVLKVRIANGGDPDFIEVELPTADLTYSRLLRLCTEELDINPSQVNRVRKLPNTIIRKDKDVARLKDGQELEIVVQPEGITRLVPCSNGLLKQIPGSNSNGYQSISLNKNQTILY